MFSFFITFLIPLVISETTNTTTVTRDYCTLPDTIYADGVTAASFSTTSWNYNNAATWAGIFDYAILDLVVTCGGSHQSPIDIVTAGATQESI